MLFKGIDCGVHAQIDYYKIMTKKEYLEWLSLLLNLDEERLRHLASDSDVPHSVRMMIFRLLNEEREAFKMLQDFRRHAFVPHKSN